MRVSMDMGLRGGSGPILLDVDFTRLPAGGAATLPGGLLYTCASGGRYLQVGTSLVVPGIGIDQAQIGRLLDADPLALVVDPARTNTCPASNPNNALHVSSFATKAAEAGPDGVAGSACIIGDADPAQTAFTNCGFAGVNGQHVTVTAWWRHVTGNAGVVIGVNFNDGGASWSVVRPQAATWQRMVLSYVQSIVSGGFVSIPAYSGAAALGSASFALMSKEIGDYPTEPIQTTGAAATRQGARLYHPTGALLAPGGRCDLRLRLRPKGASTELDAAGWSLASSAASPATDAASIAQATRRLSMIAAGATWSPAAALAWARSNIVTLDLSWGGAVANSWARYKVGAGAAVALGDSGAPLGAFSVAGALDLLCAGVAAQLGCHVERITVYRPGTLQAVPL